MMPRTEFLEIDGVELAIKALEGHQPGLFWLGGYRSDMDGTKALAMEDFARKYGLASTRFDYSGHGASGGDFLDGTISRWTVEARAIFEHYTNGPQILVGSSMGAWIALLLTKALNKGQSDDRIAGLLLLAPAPDFTAALMEPNLTNAQRQALEKQGYFEEPTPYGPEPNRFTRALFEDGRAARVMTGPIDTHCPVHILQGQADPDVPWQHAEKLYDLLSKDDATITYIKDGDHRLSRPQDLELLERTLTSLVDHC